MERRGAHGLTAHEVRVLCRVCRDRHPARTSGTLALVQIIDDGRVIVAVPERQRRELYPADGRMLWARIDGFAQLACSSCGARPRSHSERLTDLARDELAAGRDQIWL